MKLSRRGWNNLLMLFVIAFIAVLQLPNIISKHLTPPEPDSVSTAYLLPLNSTIHQINFPQLSVIQTEGIWQSKSDTGLEAENITQVVEHWSELQGSIVTDEMKQQLSLPLPSTVEIWTAEHEEPQRITVYQLPTFWLFKNGVADSIAVTVESEYLFFNRVAQ